MNHGSMDHSAMGSDTMNHHAMGHDSMDHQTMNHATMDHAAMGHEAMDHGPAMAKGSPHAMMMAMTFHGGCNEVILFDFWKISTVGGLVSLNSSFIEAVKLTIQLRLVLWLAASSWEFFMKVSNSTESSSWPVVSGKSWHQYHLIGIYKWDLLHGWLWKWIYLVSPKKWQWVGRRYAPQANHFKFNGVGTIASLLSS